MDPAIYGESMTKKPQLGTLAIIAGAVLLLLWAFRPFGYGPRIDGGFDVVLGIALVFVGLADRFKK